MIEERRLPSDIRIHYSSDCPRNGLEEKSWLVDVRVSPIPKWHICHGFSITSTVDMSVVDA